MKKWFEKICIGLIFFLSALLLMFFGIRTAGKTIAFARAERIEVINNLVDGISEGANLTSQGKKNADGGVRVPQGVFAGSGRL